MFVSEMNSNNTVLCVCVYTVSAIPLDKVTKNDIKTKLPLFQFLTHRCKKLEKLDISLTANDLVFMPKTRRSEAEYPSINVPSSEVDTEQFSYLLYMFVECFLEILCSPQSNLLTVSNLTLSCSKLSFTDTFDDRLRSYMAVNPNLTSINLNFRFFP